LGDALKEFEQALSLDSEDREVLVRMGECYAELENWERSIFYFNEAKRIYPTSARIYAELGRIHALRTDRTKAIEALNEAERLDPSDDVTAEQMICQAYDTLHQPSLALEHYERFVTLARKLGINPKAVAQFEEREQELKAMFTPVYLAEAEPTAYDEKSLEDALRARLTKDEMALVTNPLASNTEIQNWARQLTEGATNEFQKAKQLFDGLKSHVHAGPGATRTAVEAFADWHKANQLFNCQEYARLYVALAREAGVKAFYTVVERDVAGKQVSHVCSAIFIGGRVLLVDPTYRWFGAPHKEIQVLDDLQALAYHLNQLHGDIPRLRLAAKLAPTSAYTLYNLAIELLENKQLEEARPVLQRALSLDRKGAMADYAQGVFALHELRLTEAIAFFRKSLQAEPSDGMSHFGLASALRSQGRLREARDELRATLRCFVRTDITEQATRMIAGINEKIGTD
jgi:tetratricopeptide (TPR) repeat protein